MQRIDFTLTEIQLDSLRDANTEKRAVEICKIYFQRLNAAVILEENPIIGVDLRIQFPNQQPLQIEVKGTMAADIGSNNLRVSSERSFQRLSEGMPLYRVSNVGQQNVIIWVLQYPNDFQMVPEPRWRIIIRPQ